MRRGFVEIDFRSPERDLAGCQSYVCPVNFNRPHSMAFTGIRRGWHRLVNARRRAPRLLVLRLLVCRPLGTGRARSFAALDTPGTIE